MRWNRTHYSDDHLIAHLRTVRECELEVADPSKPFHRSEWSGVDRQTKWRELADEVDQLIDECHRRKIPTAPILWPGEDLAVGGD